MAELKSVAEKICKQHDLEFIQFQGEGTFKETFKVSGNDKLIALKVYFPKNFNKERTEREISSILRCDHQCIGKTYQFDYIEDDGVKFYYSLDEFFSGGTLTNKLLSCNKGKCKDIGLKIADAIGYLKKLDLVHRDLKPDNILFRDDTADFPVIVDFGIVRDLQDVSLTPSFLQSGPGTPLYSSPEQLNNEKELIDWRSDQFSLGIILSKCMLGIHPYIKKGETNRIGVERMINRNPLTDEFIIACRENSLSNLAKLVKPWPVKRANTMVELNNIIEEL